MAKVKVYTKDGDGGELELAVLSPSGKAKNDAQIYSLSVYNKAVKAGVMIRQQLDKYVRDMNLWDDERERERQRLRKALLAGELKLEKGGIRKTEAKKVAIQMSKDRGALIALTSVIDQVDANTANALSEQAYFNYLVAVCTVYNSGSKEGQPYFTADGVRPSVDSYVEQGATAAANDAAERFSELIYGKRLDKYAELPENRFLKKYGFVDDKLNLIDHEGNRVDEAGRRVNDDGFYVDSEGNPVDEDGNPVDENGRYKVEFVEFLDD